MADLPQGQRDHPVDRGRDEGMSETAFLMAMGSGYVLLGLGLLKYSLGSRSSVLVPVKISAKSRIRR